MKNRLLLSSSWLLRLIYTLVLLVGISPVLVAQTEEASNATVITDKNDYAPGSTAYITGTGFQPDEEVELHVHHARR